jgi:hypothetical protein
LIKCPHCEKYLHETCLLNEALSTKWEQIQAQKSKLPEEFDRKRLEKADAIKVEKGTNGVTHSLLNGKVKKKGRKSITTSFPWEGQMEAHLEMKFEDNEEESDEATGQVIISYDDGDKIKKFKESLRCLMKDCGKLLSESNSLSNGEANQDGD